MPDKTILDIQSENFSAYFSQSVELMTPQQKESLPKDILHKLFRNGAGVNLKNTSKLNFISKVFVLWKAIRKRWFIVVESEDGEGMTNEQFITFSNSIKAQDYTVDRSRELVSTGVFVTGSKELCDTFQYLNRLCNSPAYNYVTKIKNSPESKVEQNTARTQYLLRWLISYEQAKKKINNQKRLTPPEMYVLIGLFAYGSQPGKKLYAETFKYCYQSSMNKMKVALCTLQTKGLVVKDGDKSTSKFSISSLGIDAVNEAMTKYWVNF